MSLGAFIKQLNQCGIAPGTSILITRHTIPVVRMPTYTGSEGDPGAIILSTALPEVLGWCYGFYPENGLWVTLDNEEPPNIIDGNAAGFYLTEMTSITEGVVYDETWDPTSGEAPTIPGTPATFADSIVGGNNGTSSLLMTQNTIVGGLLSNSGEIDFDGYLAVPAGNVGLNIEFGGTPFIALPALGGDLMIGGLLSLHAQGEADRIQGLVSTVLGVACAGVAMDLSVDKDITLELDFTAATDYAVLYCYSIEVDAR